MWTKDRAMRKLQQTQQEATQLSGEAKAAYTEVESLRTENAQLTEQLKTNPLSQSLTEAQQLVTQQRQELSVKTKEIENLQRTVSQLAGQIEGMKTQITYEKRIG